MMEKLLKFFTVKKVGKYAVTHDALMKNKIKADEGLQKDMECVQCCTKQRCLDDAMNMNKRMQTEPRSSREAT